MGARAAKFTQADVTRAAKGALKGGLTPSSCMIDPDGTIRLIFGERAPEVGANPLDRILPR